MVSSGDRRALICGVLYAFEAAVLYRPTGCGVVSWCICRAMSDLTDCASALAFKVATGFCCHGAEDGRRSNVLCVAKLSLFGTAGFLSPTISAVANDILKHGLIYRITNTWEPLEPGLYHVIVKTVLQNDYRHYRTVHEYGDQELTE